MLSRRQFVAMLGLAGLAAPPAFAAPDDVIEVSGKIGDGKPRTLTLAEIEALPKAELTTHTPWHTGAVKFEGVSGEDLMKLLAAHGDMLSLEAIDNYAIKVPISDLAKFGAIFAYRIDGKELTLETKGPLFFIYPFDARPEIANESYYARCIWQIAKLDVQ